MYPDEYLDSAYVIDYKKIYEDGFRGVIFDIDNTLVPQDAPSDERSRELIASLQEIGYKVLLLSNNKEPRVELFLEGFAGKNPPAYICKASKPSRKGYFRAMEQMGTTVENTLFVGDQLFTDVWGAKRTGLRTILVKPMNPKEDIQIVFKRKLEKLWLWKYK